MAEAKYNDEKEFLKSEEKKQKNLFKIKWKNKLLWIVILVLGGMWIFSILFNLLMLDKIRQYDIEMAKTKAYVMTVSQGVMQITQEEYYIQEINNVAMYYLRREGKRYSESRLNRMSKEIYRTGVIKYGFSVDELLVLFTLESEWYRKAVSHRGAKGLV